MMKDKKVFGNFRRQTKSGSYILIVTVILLAVVVVLNVLVAALPTSLTELDISDNKVYTVGDVTKSIVSGLGENVDMFYIVEEGKEDKTVLQMLTSYDDMSDKITMTKVDPALDPNFAAQYTTDDVSSGSVIVHSEKRSTVISNSSWYRYDVEGKGEMTYDELNDLYMQFYYGGYSQQGYSFPEYKELFYGEQAFTSAIDYVTTDKLPKLIALTGHGETELNDKYKGYVSTENYTYESLSLLTGEIPEDTDVILLNKPTSDLTEDESAMLIDYVKGGGDVIVVSSCDTYTEASLPNLASMLETFGMKAEEGIVLEYNSSYVPSQMPMYFFYPSLGESAEASPVSKLASNNLGIFFGYAHGIVQTDAENVEFFDMLHTSDEAKIQKATKTDGSSDAADAVDTSAETDAVADTDASADADASSDAPVTVDGQATVAACAQYTGGGKVVWYASDAITDSDYDVVRGNSALFIATLNSMSGKTESISIIGKELHVETFTPSENTKTLWTVVLCVIVPVAILGAGIIVWACRRRK